MEFLGKSMSTLFEGFYAAHVDEHIRSVEVTYHEIKDDDASFRGEGHLEFGYTIQDPLQPDKAEIHVRPSIPADDLHPSERSVR